MTTTISNFNQQPINQPTISQQPINQPTIGLQFLDPSTAQAMANLGIAMQPAQLQQLFSAYQSLDPMHETATLMNPAAQMSFNTMLPSQAYQMYAPTMAPSYYSGQQYMPMSQMQSNYGMSQQYMQQAMEQYGMQNYNNPGAFGGLNGYGSMGGMGGAGMPVFPGSNSPGSSDLTANQQTQMQQAALAKYMDTWEQTMLTSTKIEAASRNISDSIIQNIR
jgi:hypothetical protein